MTNFAIKVTVSEFKGFMDRSCGRWVSHRRYLFGRNLKSGEYTTEFDIELKDGNNYSVTWSGQTEGTMDLVLEGDELKRSRTYYDSNDDSTSQKMTSIDEDAVVFRTSYDGTSYREEIRFLGDDIRLRQNVGTNIETGDVTLVGQYYEVRVV